MSTSVQQLVEDALVDAIALEDALSTASPAGAGFVFGSADTAAGSESMGIGGR